MRVITLSRQFGSGGGEIAKKVAEKLNIKYVDKSILAEAASGSGIAKEHFEKADERRTNSFLYSLATAHYGGTAAPIQLSDIITDDKLFIHTADAIKRLAGEPCVIVGRCADDILSDRAIIRVYVYADMKSRVERICKLYDLNEKAATTLIKKTDKKRANYYNFYTSKTWGDAQNYDLCLNSDALGIDGTADMIKEFALSCERGKK
ncbi:MAG: cytidylate kinase-like family protein [Clostridia bacterium]|jgi:cytidylate kinase|uniref:cytidylate kinase-like family protein n=1 Tax=Pumilibacter muris TaxID=2941510 RepID=UPI00203A6B98|nr:cytidylate kinase-like family protein [Pumilibacter muris]MCI8595362.1 cytidylate kinase-like family protein [Clostridia bacterium]